MDADVSVVQYENKIKRLLEKLLEPYFEIKSDTCLNTLLSYLSGKDNKELGKSLVNFPELTDWLLKGVQFWEETSSIPKPTVISFTVHLAGLLSKSEHRFVALNSCNLYVRLCTTLKLRTPECLPIVKLAYIKLLASFLEHKSGVEWLISTNNWQDVLQYCLAGQTIYIVREGQDFMYKLLLKGCTYNNVFCCMVIEKIMVVLNQLHFTSGSVIPEINEELLQKKLTPTLKLISYILESSLESELFAGRDYTVPSIFMKNCHLEQNIWNIIMMGSHNQELSGDLNEVLLLAYFLGLAIDSEEQLFECKDIRKLSEDIFKLLKMCIAKGDSLNVLKVCHEVNHYWKAIECRLRKITDTSEVPILFENQIIMFQVMPMFMVTVTYCGIQLDEIDDIFREEFINKLFKIMCEPTIRVVYSYRNLLYHEKDAFDIAYKSLMYIMKSRKYYHRDRGVIIFQSLMYVFNDVVDVIKKKPEAVEIFLKHVGYLAAHLDALAIFIKEFNITWRESIETICVMGVSMDFMSLPIWPTTLVTHALKLVNISIARFMSPNLALLVDRTSDSSMATLGNLLVGKLHDMDWEVRDSALEVLHTVSSIAYSKFPSFQGMLLESELPSLMVTMCMFDSESYVRASAIKCLQEMIKVPAFWNRVLQQEDLPQKMIQVLYNETEANVRCEAASLMCRIYEHQSIPISIMDKVDQAMVYAATLDLHWEVKLNALCYWSKTINNHLANQGMIDGSFPTVTFSKENRKIVTLTEKEIKTRLNKVLLDLSKCGCLGVLVDATQDESDIEVAKKAVSITKRLAELLKCYTVNSENTSDTPTSPKAVMDTFNLVSGSPTTKLSDDVINEIINCQDLSLLTNVYVKNEKLTFGINTAEIQIKIVTPKEFLQFIRQNLDDLISIRINWLNKVNDLESLLDDMLNTYEENDDEEVNAMDCY